MPRYLKTKGNCAHCRQEVPLTTLKHAERVRCQHCRELFRIMSLVHHREREALELYKEATKAQGPRRARLYLLASSLRLEAAALVLEAYEHGMRGIAPAVQRQWVAWAQNRTAWASGLGALVAPMLKQQQAEAGRWLQLVEGGLNSGQLPAAPSSHGRPHVALLSREEP